MTIQQSSNSLIKHPEVSDLLIHQSTTGYKPTQLQFISHHNLSPCFSKITLLDVVNKCSSESSPTKFCRYFQFPHTTPPPQSTQHIPCIFDPTLLIPGHLQKSQFLVMLHIPIYICPSKIETFYAYTQQMLKSLFQVTITSVL